MWEKFKKLISKMKMKTLIIVAIMLVVVISIDKVQFDIESIEVFNSDYLNEPINIVRDISFFYAKIKIVIWIILIIDILLIILKLMLKDNITVLMVNTFNNTNTEIKSSYINTEVIKGDFSSDVKLLRNDYLQYKKVIEKIDYIAEKFMDEKKKGSYAFAGIMHTPFIVRLGFKIGDETYFKLYHKKRDKDYFELLKNRNEYIGNLPKLNVEKRLKDDSNELIVAISTTFDIREEKLEKFNLENNNYIKFETSEKGFDVIRSEKQINEYKNCIFREVRGIVQDKDIKKIHLCISSSVAFTFAIGQGLSKNYDPQVIVYNYEDQKYTWGVDIFSESNNSIIYNE